MSLGSNVPLQGTKRKITALARWTNPSLQANFVKQLWIVTAQVSKRNFRSAGSLKANEAENKISQSLALEFSSLFNIHPLFLSQDQVSFAEETGLGAARTCASRSAQGEKLRGFWVDVVFWLKLETQVVDRGPLFLL